jgi:D-glycero-alpha-D-manno-heptose-7-phosphate kinase
MLIVRSPVRISFGGGGTDLPSYYQKFGGNVLSAAINKYFYTVLQRRTDGKIQIISADLRTIETWQDIARMDVRGNELEIPLAILKEFGCDLAVNLFLASEIPPGTGLGSSASVCVNLIKTLTSYTHSPLSKYELAERAFDIARNVLGRPVGKQDEYASAFGGLNFMSFETDGTTLVEPLNLDPDLIRELQMSLMLFFTGSSHHSWTILEEQEQSTRQTGTRTAEYLHEIRRLAVLMRAALLSGSLGEFASLLHKGWETKKRLSSRISNNRIDEMYRSAIQCGASGGKITGAGGGGFLLLFCPQQNQQRVREALMSMGAREMGFEFDSQGAQVVADDPFIDGDGNGGSYWTFIHAKNKASGNGKNSETGPADSKRTPLGRGELIE